MPQEQTHTILLEDSTLIQYDPALFPPGFDTLPLANKKMLIKQYAVDYISMHEKEQKASASDIILPAMLVIGLAMVILFIAIKIRNNPKVYDAVVKLDGDPNP